mgnify:FL=1
MIRVVLDTNVLINAERGEFSHPKRILDLIRNHQLEAVITHAVQRENELIVKRLVKDKNLQGDIREYVALATEVKPVDVDVAIDDDEDIKILAAAVGGKAKFLITDDKHLLDIGDYAGVRILRPSEFWQWWQTEQDSRGATWTSWMGDLFR